jgi:hypothetical protein
MSEQPTQSEQIQCLLSEILDFVDFGIIQGFPLDLYLRIKEQTEFQALLDLSEPLTEEMWLEVRKLTDGVEVNLDTELSSENE